MNTPGVISGTGMVDAMATTIVNVLPASMAPHMHWFMALFSVPLKNRQFSGFECCMVTIQSQANLHKMRE